MDEIIEYLKNTYSETAFTALIIVYSVLFVGLILSLVLAISSSVKRAKNKCEGLPETNKDEKIGEPIKGKDDDTEEKEAILAKWVIETDGGTYQASLLLNGRALLRSAKYKSLSGVKSAIITISNNLAEKNAAESVENNGKFSFKVFSSSGKVLAEGEEKDLSADSLNDLLVAEECANSSDIPIEVVNK